MAERIGKLLKTYDRKEGAVKDLAEKLRSNELTCKETLKHGFYYSVKLSK